MSLPEVFECEQCGADLTPGVDHDCPVGGNIVRIETAGREGKSQKA